MFKELRDIVYDNNFRVILEDGKLSIKSFKEVLVFEDDRILINTRNGYINIKGNDLRVTKLENHEIMILGKIKTIEF